MGEVKKVKKKIKDLHKDIRKFSETALHIISPFFIKLVFTINNIKYKVEIKEH